MAKPTTPTIPIVEAIASAGEADLLALREQITAQEQSLAQWVADKQRSIDTLRAAARLIEIRLHGNPMRAKKTKKKASPGDATQQPAQASEADDGGRDRHEYSELANAIYDLLAKEGAMPVPAIAARLGRAPAAVGSCASRCDWFERTSAGEFAIAKT